MIRITYTFTNAENKPSHDTGLYAQDDVWEALSAFKQTKTAFVVSRLTEIVMARVHAHTPITGYREHVITDSDYLIDAFIAHNKTEF